MKKLYHIIGVFLLFTLTLLNPNLTAGQNFGTDVPVLPDSLCREYFPQIAVAENGWVYVAFSSSRPALYSSYGVYISKDGGASWQTLFQIDLTSGAAYYPFIRDLVVVGSDTNNLQLFVAFTASGNGSPMSIGFVNEYNGKTGAFVNRTLSIGDGVSCGINDIAIATDATFPSVLSSPFSLGVIYAQKGSGISDSVITLVSADGGQTFAPAQVIDTSIGEFNYVDIDYGYASSQSGGSYVAGFTKDYHLGICQSTGNILGSFSAPMYLDTLSASFTNNIYNFSISAERGNYNNTNNSWTIVVMSSINWDPVGFYNLSAGDPSAWQFSVLENDTLLFSSNPSIDYDPTTRQFVTSWLTYDGFNNNTLKCARTDYASVSTWDLFQPNYCDTPSYLDKFTSDPEIKIDPNSGIIYTTWSQYGPFWDPYQGGGWVYADHASIPILVPELAGAERFSVYPNPVLSQLQFQNKNFDTGEFNYSIFAADGQLMDSGKIKIDGHRTIDLPATMLSPGIYQLYLFSEKLRYTSRFIKM